ncbi:MAG: hypothetical protein AAF991_08820 [Pseudomonadota bacterium]
MAFIECRDTSISLWHDGAVARSPGFVLLDGKEYRFGDEARAQARLRPRDSSSRYWWQLSTQPLKPALGSARHTADLVHAHLQALHKEAAGPEALVLVVPESMPREQLSLLLGVAQACDFDIQGLVSRSTLLASQRPGQELNDRVLVHVEAQLNQAVVNQVRVADGAVFVEKSTPLPSCGLLSIYERCLSAISSAFVQQTRFDPRRSAESEQTLFNQLPDLLSQLDQRGEVSVDIEGHRCRFTNSTLESVLEKLKSGVDEAVEGLEPVLLFDTEFQGLPEIGELFKGGVFLDPHDSWNAWEQQKTAIALDDPEMRLIDRLPVNFEETGDAATDLEGDQGVATPETPAVSKGRSESATPTQAQVTAQASPVNGTTPSSASMATHILLGTKALPLRGEHIELADGFSLRLSGSAWTLHGDDALVNGMPSSPRQALQLGDTLSLGTVGHGRLIEVVE